MSAPEYGTPPESPRRSTARERKVARALVAGSTFTVVVALGILFMGVWHVVPPGTAAKLELTLGIAWLLACGLAGLILGGRETD